MKKKLFAVLMAAAMVFGMTACGSGESADTTAETTGDDAGSHIHIATPFYLL